MSGWLVEQLPRVLAQDRFTRRFVTIFEEIGDGVRSQLDALGYYVDADTAPPEFVRWMTAWLAVPIDEQLPAERQREIARAAGRTFRLRGTQAALRELLEAMTGAPVRIVDGGGVWRAGEGPPNPGRILVRLESNGGIDETQLYRLIRNELPIGISFELRLGDRTIGPARGTPDLLGAIR